MQNRTLHLLGPLLVVLAAGCRSSAGAPEPEPLPFHVALVPLRSSLVVEGREPGADATGMRLEPDPARLTEAVREALASRTFVRVSLLEGVDPPAGATDQRDRDRLRLARARELNADLVLELELAVAPTVRHGASGNAWLDIPFFLLGGPFVWFVNDRTYRADVELRGAFYDRWALESEQRLLGDRFARVLDSSASFEGLDLNFFERTRKANLYLLSILVPSYFLARESDTLAQNLAAEVVDRLGSSFAAGVLRRGDELVRADLTAGFHLVPAETHLEPRPGGGFRLSATILQRADDLDELARWRVLDGRRTLDAGEFGDPAPQPRGERWRAWRLERELQQPVGAETLSLELEAGTRTPVTRSYTLRVPAAAR